MHWEAPRENNFESHVRQSELSQDDDYDNFVLFGTGITTGDHMVWKMLCIKLILNSD